jgi:hypothetical protein
MMGCYSEETRFAFQRNENIMFYAIYKGEKLDSRYEINTHIVVFTYQFYRFILDVYNDVHQFSNNRAFVVK